ncbi:hypothetical protein [Paenibacillus mesotrionivorans]|uniref:Uncharacterized protein n=1 Tax=Paenibacillus mesotrionivorans TaxID=3160968 RepID=A0ACC7P3W0_9BACL
MNDIINEFPYPIQILLFLISGVILVICYIKLKKINRIFGLGILLIGISCFYQMGSLILNYFYSSDLLSSNRFILFLIFFVGLILVAIAGFQMSHNQRELRRLLLMGILLMLVCAMGIGIIILLKIQ